MCISFNNLGQESTKSLEDSLEAYKVAIDHAHSTVQRDNYQGKADQLAAELKIRADAWLVGSDE